MSERLNRWLPAGSMMLVSVLSYVDRNTLALLAPTILKDTHMSVTAYGWGVSAYSILFTVGNPLWGQILDRIGLRRGLSCAVLAETEIINHVSEGVGVENILRGIHNSLADRGLGLLKRVGLDGEVTFIGGVARQAGMVLALREKLGVPVNVPEAPEFVTALGAAILGRQRYRKLTAAAGTPAAA